MEYPNNRKEAKALGSKYYFTGEPCKHGHIALRKTKGACTECLKIEWEQSKQSRSQYYKDYNKSEAGQQAKRKYYENNKDDVIARAQARTKEAKNRYKLKYKQNNPELYKELVNVRRRRFRQATPKWLNKEQKLEIRMRYKIALELSRTTGTPYAVDHIIPINGETVCGLHVPWNLRVITQDENLKKSNKLTY